jgi:hypothetical protein
VRCTVSCIDSSPMAQSSSCDYGPVRRVGRDPQHDRHGINVWAAEHLSQMPYAVPSWVDFYSSPFLRRVNEKICPSGSRTCGTALSVLPAAGIIIPLTRSHAYTSEARRMEVLQAQD